MCERCKELELQLHIYDKMFDNFLDINKQLEEKNTYYLEKIKQLSEKNQPKLSYINKLIKKKN